MSRLTKTEEYLILSFLYLLTVPLLYIFRSVDDNTLTSWRWIFSNTSPGQVLFIMTLCFLPALLISKSPLMETHPVFTVLLLASLVSVSLWGVPEVILDGGRYFLESKYLEKRGIGYFLKEWGGEITPWTDMPLVPFLYGLLFKIFGEKRFIIQAFNTTLFTLTLMLTYLSGKRLFSKETGLYGSLFLLCIPYLLTQVPLMLVDIATMFFFMLSVYLTIRALSYRGHIWPFLAGISVFLTLLSKFSAWPMLSIILIIPLARGKGEIKDGVLQLLKILILAGLLFTAYFIFKKDTLLMQLDLLFSFQRPGLKMWQEGYVSTFLYQSHPFLLVLSFVGIYQAVRKKDFRVMIPLWFFILVVALGIKRIRYTIPLFPLFSIMAAYGLSFLKRRETRRYLVLLTVTSSLVLLYTAYIPFLKDTSMMNLKRAGEFLNSTGADSFRVHTIPQGKSRGSTFMAVPILDLYTSGRICTKQEWQPRPGSFGAGHNSLRFTWEYKKPGFYSCDTPSSYFVIISGKRRLHPAEELKPRLALKLIKRFDSESRVFRYKTFVEILRQD